MAKIERVSPKVRNKTRMPTLTITVQHSFGSFSHSNQTIKRNKRKPDWIEEIKLSLFADDMILYIETLTIVSKISVQFSLSVVSDSL